MHVLVINSISGRLDLLEAVLERAREESVGAVFVLGNIARDGVVCRQALQLLGALGVGVYLIPGPEDLSVAALSQALQDYRGPGYFYLVHRNAMPLGGHSVVAGFGGLLTTTQQHDPATVQFPAWEARVAFEHLSAYNTAFQTASRRVLLFATPPQGRQVDKHYGTHTGLQVLNYLIRAYQPHLVCCAGPASGRGVEVIAGALVINPGSLAEGSFALVDLEREEARLEALSTSPRGTAPSFRSIVVALDGSEEANHALEAAASLARQIQARLTLVYAFEPVRMTLGEPYLSEQFAERIAYGEHLMGKATQRIADLHPRCEVVEGPVSDAIVRVAETEDADLIVMGARGLGAVRALLGSVSLRVLQHASCPVLLVREGARSTAVSLDVTAAMRQ